MQVYVFGYHAKLLDFGVFYVVFFCYFLYDDLLGGGVGALLEALVQCTCCDLVGGERRGMSNEGTSFFPH